MTQAQVHVPGSTLILDEQAGSERQGMNVAEWESPRLRQTDIDGSRCITSWRSTIPDSFEDGVDDKYLSSNSVQNERTSTKHIEL
jgi:hypothetical protein